MRAEQGDQHRGAGTMRIPSSGRCLSPRHSWLAPLPVQAAAVLGVAAESRNAPQPEPGR